jgi:two-component system response regulator DesR
MHALIRVLVIGDSVPVMAKLATAADIQVVGALTFDAHVASLATEFWPDVVVFNTDYMVSQVLPAVAELKARIAGCSALLLADLRKPGMLPPRRIGRRVGFLVKDAGPDVLTDAIRRLANGERVVHPRLQVASLGLERDVSTRELEVLGLAAEGEPVPVVADRLCLSERTVRNYLSATVRKMGARNLLDAVRLARQEGWLR